MAPHHYHASDGRWLRSIRPIGKCRKTIDHVLSNPLFKHRCQLDTDTGKAGWSTHRAEKSLAGRCKCTMLVSMSGCGGSMPVIDKMPVGQKHACVWAISTISWYLMPANCCRHSPVSRVLKRAKLCMAMKTGALKGSC